MTLGAVWMMPVDGFASMIDTSLTSASPVMIESASSTTMYR